MKGETEESQKRYILIIVETDQIGGQAIYERVAVGHISSQDILPAACQEIVVIRWLHLLSWAMGDEIGENIILGSL